jgi:hypothetical protein
MAGLDRWLISPGSPQAGSRSTSLRTAYVDDENPGTDQPSRPVRHRCILMLFASHCYDRGMQ